MNLRELYSSEKGDYEKALYNLNGEANIKKYLKILSESSDINIAYDLYLHEKNDEAYRLIHGLKGVALNLDFQMLHLICYDLCKSINNNDNTEADFKKLINHFGELKKYIYEIL